MFMLCAEGCVVMEVTSFSVIVKFSGSSMTMRGLTVDQYFSSFNVYTDGLRIWLKCRLRLNRPGVGPEITAFLKSMYIMLNDAVGPWTTL